MVAGFIAFSCSKADENLQITSFKFEKENDTNKAEATTLKADAEGKINHEDGTITVTVDAKAVTALAPTIKLAKGATVSPASGTAKDFSAATGVDYTVTSDGKTKKYTVKVTKKS
ncbi:hypothetical protein JBKA6_0071 [Ichthyobacterium seriolicida]|uniref:Uncharacterized protein n=1 Tax=Ichthyobacterium seriolicida TaxID=242600 RepID=A0A1J1E221_9FLAO|nr:hypothetical protein JBKA6_0071 [Ichthyobacterium seriolicida]